jgi:hypothetical protein
VIQSAFSLDIDDVEAKCPLLSCPIGYITAYQTTVKYNKYSSLQSKKLQLQLTGSDISY